MKLTFLLIFGKFIDFASVFNSRIHLLKVNTPSNFESTVDAKQKVKSFISDFELSNKKIHIYSDVSVEKGIQNFSQEINADLIALLLLIVVLL